MKIIKIAFLFISLYSTLMAQLNMIPLNVDYATFKGSGDKTYVEFYLSFFQQDLKYEKTDTVFVAKFSHSILISDKDSVIFSTTRNYKNSTIQTQLKLNNQFVDVFPVELDSGKFMVTANIVDKISNKHGEFSFNIDVPDYSSNFSLSSIQFSNNIKSESDNSNFSLKNNIKILPNPSGTYTVINPILYFYFEGYNLLQGQDQIGNYSYRYYISDLNGKLIRSYPKKTKSIKSDAIAEVKGINVIALNSEPYFLNIVFTDLNRNDSTFIRKKFLVNKPVRTKSEDDMIAKIEGFEEYSSLNSDQLRNEFNIVKYIATSEEIDIFEKLNDDLSMKRFLSQFWKRRDTNKETEVNEYKLKYIENLRIANANYSTHFKEGWKTDRGRVMLIYDKPDEIQRNPSTLNSQPYEIWYYYSLEGGVEFIFADITGNGTYELLHSTYRNEIKDPNWRSRVEKLRSRQYDSGFDRF